MDPESVATIQEVVKMCLEQAGVDFPGWLKGLLSFLVLNIIGINGKFAYDFFQVRKQPAGNETTVSIQQSPGPERAGERCVEHLNRIKSVEQEVHSIRPMLERFDERSNALIKRLEDGDDKFKVFDASINKLCVGIKVMAAKMQALKESIDEHKNQSKPKSEG